MSKIVHQQIHVKVWALFYYPCFMNKTVKKNYQFSGWFLYRSFRHPYYIHSLKKIHDIYMFRFNSYIIVESFGIFIAQVLLQQKLMYEYVYKHESYCDQQELSDISRR